MDRSLNLLFNYFRPLAATARAGQRRYGHPPRARMAAWQYFLYGFLLGAIPRFIFIGVALKRGDQNQVLQDWEPIIFYASQHFSILTGNLMLCLALLPAFAAYFQYLYDFKVYRISAALLAYDLFVDNCRNLLKRNPELMPRFRLGNPYASVKGTVVTMWETWKGKHDKRAYLETLTLEHFPGLSKRVRFQAALLALFLEYFTVIMMELVVIVCGVLGIQYCFGRDGFLLQRHSLVVYFRFVLESIILSYGTMTTVFFVFYGVTAISLLKFIYKHQLRELGEQLQASLAKVSRWAMTPSAYAVHVERYRRLHSTIWRNVYLLKVQLVDTALLVLVTSNVFTNVFLISQLLFQRKLALIEKMVFGFTIFAETAVGLSGWTLFANFAAMLYTSARYLHRTTLFLVGPSRLPDKLKMMSYYEMVHSTNRLTFSIGSLFRIDKELFLNYVFMYTGYIFYVSKLVKKNAALEQTIKAAAAADSQ